jgi:hypothetical protein
MPEHGSHDMTVIRAGWPQVGHLRQAVQVANDMWPAEMPHPFEQEPSVTALLTFTLFTVAGAMALRHALNDLAHDARELAEGVYRCVKRVMETL